MPNRLLAIGLWMTTLWLAGCGSAAVGPTDGLPVTGTLTRAGKPVSYAMIEFAPVEALDLRQSTRVIDGKYQFVPAHGLSEGEYNVRVLPFEPEIEDMERARQEGKPLPAPARHPIPVQFQKEGAFQVKLSADSVDGVDFDMKP